MEYSLLVDQLKKELIGIQKSTTDIVKQCNFSIELSRNLLSDFKTAVKKHGFSDLSREIAFFKRIKPVPMENLIYHFELKSFEVRLPRTSILRQRKYIRKEQKKLETFFRIHLDFAQYVAHNKTFMDDRYYTRAFFGKFNISHSNAYYRDPEFSTSHDLLLAKLIANKRLAYYFGRRLDNLREKEAGIAMDNGCALKWTASSIDLSELSYGLKYSGAVNHGNVNVKDIQTALEIAFGARPGNPYKNKTEMRIRTKSRTKFMDSMSRALLDKMDREDG